MISARRTPNGADVREQPEQAAGPAFVYTRAGARDEPEEEAQAGAVAGKGRGEASPDENVAQDSGNDVRT